MRRIAPFLIVFCLAVGSALPAFARLEPTWRSNFFCSEFLKPESALSLKQKTRLAPMLEEAVTFIRSGEATAPEDLCARLVRTQADYLKSVGVQYRISSNGKWIDILPRAKGSAFERYAYRLEHETFQRAVLRYDPRVLLEDSRRAAARVFQPAIYLSHFDLVGRPQSDFFKLQTQHYDVLEMNELLKPDPDEDLRRQIRQWMGGDRAPGRSDAEFYEKDFYPPENQNSPRDSRESYFRSSPLVGLIEHVEDPVAIRYGASHRIYSEDPGGSIIDYSGFRVRRIAEGQHRVAEVEDPTHLLSDGRLRSFALDTFLEEMSEDQLLRSYFKNQYSGNFSRQMILPSGKSLYQVAGGEVPESVFGTYLSFLGKIYATYPDLLIGKKLMARIRGASLAFRKKSLLIAWSSTRDFLEKPKAEKLLAGLIFAVSETSVDRLPLEWIRNLPAGAVRNETDEIVVEMGRLGSLEPGETIDMLKVAGLSLYNQYGRESGKRIRIVCEGNGWRERYFERFGFRRAKSQIKGLPFYQTGEDYLLEVDLEDFLKAVLK